MKFLSVFSIGVGLAASSVTQAQNLVTNGDFETAPYTTANTVTSWTVTPATGGVSEAAEGATSSTHSAAFTPKGAALSQVLTTTSGQTYSLDFDAGIFGQPSGAPLQLRAQVLGNATLLDQLVTPPALHGTLAASHLPRLSGNAAGNFEGNAADHTVCCQC